MSSRNEISALLAGRIAAGDFPSAVYLVAEAGRVALSDALGHAVTEPYERRAATPDTIYDLASLTKPLVTGLLCARLIESRELALRREVGFYLPEFDLSGKRAITVGQLLTHTSGLPAWRPLYIEAEDSAAVLRVIAEQPLESAPGTRVCYSDLGFITLGLLIEKLAGGRRLSEIARREIFEPLGLKRTFFNPEAALRGWVAACETGNSFEREMCRELKAGEHARWREHLIWGEVHDGNAHFLGGAAGHAGLFSTAPETFRLAQQFTPQTTQLLRPETCALFRTNMTEGLEEARSLAWQLAATPGSTAGPSLASDSFGHTGFTGTSCWIEPERERVFILLTNRTHAAPLPFVNINSVRRSFHTLAVAALEK
ncbi:MAG TPA: serine hydrolase domain-containing protein [Pyrinomonadaceae bacterium]|jgi:CubicO group peptidase (beta-lactamase class C family)|nr:serine hydrolase domain-containing protein [Pyrinomonadaceae bacterium]